MLRIIGQICLRVHHLSTCPVSRKPYIPRDKFTPRENTGIHRRLKLIEEDEADIQNADIDYQSLQELEEDITQAADLNDEILRDMKRMSISKKLKITERKFFKPPKEPQMLTWSDKEQIIQLHRKDPEKWSPEVLAESFPASPAIIKKILKTKWKPQTSERLKAHDHKVSENWIAFHRGELKVHDPKLQAHLAKFIDRKNGVRILSDEEAAKITEIILPKPKKTEFLSLVTSFKPKIGNERSETENKRLEENIQPLKRIGEESLNNIVDKSKAFYTLDKYRERLSVHLNKCPEDREEIEAIVNSGYKNSSVGENSPYESYVAPSESFKPDATVHQKRKISRLKLIDPDDVPNQIAIPKDKWKEGSVYRVNDCFYNDKGYFLYRVPGLKAE